MLISAKEIINKSFELLKRDFNIWKWYLLVNFGAALLSFLLAFNPSVLLFLGTLGLSSTVVFLFNMIVVLLLTVFDIWFHLALIRTIHTRLFNQAALSMKQQFAQTQHLLARAIAISIIVSVIVFLPLGLSFAGVGVTGFENLVLGNIKSVGMLYMFFGLLGLYGIFHFIYFSIKYVFSYYIVAIDEKIIQESLHQGNKLTHGRMFEIFWRLAAPIILFLLAYILLDRIFFEGAKLIAHPFAVYIADILSLAVSAVVALLGVISSVILYEDAKAKPLETSKITND